MTKEAKCIIKFIIIGIPVNCIIGTVLLMKFGRFNEPACVMLIATLLMTYIFSK